MIKCGVVSAGVLGKVLVMGAIPDVGSVGDTPSKDNYTKRARVSDNQMLLMTK